MRSLQQFENLRLDRHVERGRRFVGHEQFRFARQRHGDHHALLHAAGHLERIILDARFRRGNPDEFQESDDLGVVRLLRLVQLERFLDLVADAKDGIQRRARFLENITHNAAANLPQFARSTSSAFAAIQQNFPADVIGRRRRHEPRDGKCGHSFAAAAFTDETNCFARADGQRHTVHGAQRIRARAEVHFEISNFEQRHDRALDARFMGPSKVNSGTAIRLDCRLPLPIGSDACI